MSSSSIVKAHTLFSADGLSITRIAGRPRTPGNVGLALSGGGSRSAASCMGVVRTLRHFGLLEHLRAISCISGGSWFSIPFTFLPPHFDEHTFLGHYVEDPASLRWYEGADSTALRTLPAGNFGVELAKFGLSTASLLAEALRDRYEGVHTNRLWSRQIGELLLAPFDLACFDGPVPADTFAGDRSVARSMAMNCPHLPEPYLVREHEPRPYLIVGGALRVRDYDGVDCLAPVQFTPWYSGVFGTEVGTLGGHEVGGGGVSSYAFGGQWLLGESEHPEVEVHSPLALSDIAGISSAAFADALNDRGMTELSPSLVYFSPHWRSPAGVHGLFADGGSLENTGIANLLAYEDIDSVIAVINAPEGLRVRDGELVVERQVPALFGYRQWERGVGYARFDVPGKGNPDNRYNQVFDHQKGQFQELLRAMAELHEAGEPIIVEQELELVDNPRFAVKGGRKVRVLWFYLSRSHRWFEQLHPGVKLTVDLRFPNLPTARTMLSESDVSLLAHFSSWALGQHRDQLMRLFFPDA
jgi:hypothetical protein